jgi:hypothetical protein
VGHGKLVIQLGPVFPMMVANSLRIARHAFCMHLRHQHRSISISYNHTAWNRTDPTNHDWTVDRLQLHTPRANTSSSFLVINRPLLRHDLTRVSHAAIRHQTVAATRFPVEHASLTHRFRSFARIIINDHQRTRSQDGREMIRCSILMPVRRELLEFAFSARSSPC